MTAPKPKVPNSSKQPAPPTSSLACYHCKEIGHLMRKCPKSHHWTPVVHKPKETNVEKNVDKNLANGALKPSALPSMDSVPHVALSSSAVEHVAGHEALQVALAHEQTTLVDLSPLVLDDGSSSVDSMVWSPEKDHQVHASRSSSSSHGSPMCEVVDCVLVLPTDFPSKHVIPIQPATLAIASQITLSLNPANSNPFSPLSQLDPPA